MVKTAFITGITGQDGSCLTELLLSQGYMVHGLVRRNSNTVRSRIDHLTRQDSIYGKSLFLHYGDLDDLTTIRRILLKTKPDEVYHLAGQSHVGASFEIPESTCEFTAMGTLRLLEVLRDCDPLPKFAHASSSEIFGEPDEAPQNEDTPMRRTTPYGVAKAFATQMVRVYPREARFIRVQHDLLRSTNRPGVASLLSRARSRVQRSELKPASSERCRWAILMAKEIGAAPDYV